MLPHGSAPKAEPLVIYPQHHTKRKTIEMNQFQSLSFFYIVFLFWWNTLSLRRRRRAMFWFLFKTGFVFSVPENVAVLHSPKVWFKAQPAPAWSWYCQKLPTGNFSGAACWIWQFVKTFSLAEKWIENKFSIWSLLFAHKGLGKIAYGNRAKLLLIFQKCAWR